MLLLHLIVFALRYVCQAARSMTGAAEVMRRGDGAWEGRIMYTVKYEYCTVRLRW